MLKKKKLFITRIDISSSNNFSPKKCWSELLISLKNIYVNFSNSQISPDELKFIIEDEENNTINGVPDVESIENLINQIYTLIGEYKIPGDTSLFLEFRRLAAIYLFSIGSQDKSIEILKDIIKIVDNKISNRNNFDLNLMVIKDCVQLNLAFIHFFLEEFEEAEELITHVVSFYESTDDELYLIKMVNFVSVSFTYLGWIFIRKNNREDAEKSFLHALKIINTVKVHSRDKYNETNFIDTKSKKIFIYDQLINFNTYIEEYHNCYNPLQEILKIMDKPTFKYNLDITPSHHVYYYVTIILYKLKLTKKEIDLGQILLYFSNIITIVFHNSDCFDIIPPVFYDKIFLILGLIDGETQMLDKSFEIENIDSICDYLDEIIGKFDNDRILSLNPASNSSSFADTRITLERYSNYIMNQEFVEFNAISSINLRHSETELAKILDEEITEIFTIKIATDRLLLKYAKIIIDLIDCQDIQDKIVMEGLNGFLVIENDEMVLYSIYRFIARNKNNTDIHNEEDFKENDNQKETLRIFIVKNVEHKFAPLYYKRITFKLTKDTKAFNFSIYFALLNVLINKKLYRPCISLISMFLNDVNSILKDLYSHKSFQKTEGFLYLYEFLLFLQVYLFVSIKNYERALFALLQVKTNINEYNSFLQKTLLGLCLTHCYYYDLAIVKFSEAVALAKPLIDMYSNNSDEISHAKTPECINS
jgi:tetratricopeptide (TPR) repeat protein